MFDSGRTGRRTTSRRDVLAGGLALGAGLLCASAPARAQATRLAAGTIDVHHHFFPPVLQDSTFRMLAGVFGEVPARIRDWRCSNASLSPSELAAIQRDNILRLMPQLA
jgi:hypothetical protein